MAKLTTKERNALPASAFAGPDRSFPVEDANHARAALSRAAGAKNAGRITEAIYAHIVKKADKKLGVKSIAEDVATARKK